jgi:hypothetical protein
MKEIVVQFYRVEDIFDVSRDPLRSCDDVLRADDQGVNPLPVWKFQTSSGRERLKWINVAQSRGGTRLSH